MDIFKLSRTWFDFCFENPEKIKPNHSALYFFCIEHCNRLGWKEKFGLPTTMAKEAIGISSYNTYIQTLNDLIEWGFIKLIEKSKNQYSSNIIALSKYNKALDKALDKALIKHSTTHCKSTQQSTDSIDIQETILQETINKYPFVISEFRETFFNWLSYKKARKESYVDDKSIKLCYNKLLKLSNNNSNTAKLIVEQSMANNWAGLFELKEKDIHKEENKVLQRIDKYEAFGMRRDD